jgi:hypothetical protein
MNEVKVKGAVAGAIGTIESRWKKLDGKRTAVLSRARECASVTIPALLPPLGYNESSTLPTPYQGLGARGVNNLSAKLLLALLPPNQPCFRMSLDDFTLDSLTGKEGMRAEVDKALNKIERAVTTEIETSGARVPIFNALKYLVAVGNTLLYLPDGGGIKCFRLDRYVVQRDPMGNVIDIIVKESVSQTLLPEGAKVSASKGDGTDDNVDLFTRICRKKQKQGHTMWEVAQEANGAIIPGSQGTYPLDESPWIPLRWTSVDGENYGRGLVEEYLGDLISLEALSQAIVEGSAAAAKVLFLNNPNGTTRTKKVAEAENGAIVDGNAADITVLQMQKFNDFRVALETITKIEQRLAQAFLLMSAIQRNAERVTAEEIRQMVAELESALGGVYSVLSQDLQLPLVKRFIQQMTAKGVLPQLPIDKIKPMITTGLEALGRGHDLNQLESFIQGIMPLGADILAQYMNIDDYITRRGTALGIDMAGLIKTKEEVAQAQQQAMLMQAAQNAAPGAISQLTKGAVDQAANQPEGATTNG